MQIKRTFAGTMREALQKVKTEQGPDAIILGNNKVPGGVEILSAVDPQEEWLQPDWLQSQAQSQQPPQQPRQRQSQARSPAQAQASVHAATQRHHQASGIQAAASSNAASGYAATAAASARTAAPITRQLSADESLNRRLEPVIGDLENEMALDDLHDLMLALPSDAKQVAQTRQAIDRKLQGRRLKTETAVPGAKASGTRSAAQQAYSQNAESLKPRLAEAPRADEKSTVQPLINEMKDEIKTLRGLMENQLNVLEWDRFSRRHPVRAVLLNLLTEMGLGSDICDQVLHSLGDSAKDPHKVWQLALALLARSIPVAQNDLLAEGGVIAMVGSTGVGKTTTIAKIAARFAHTHGKRQVALISTDTFRIGAQEQLQHFARLLEIPLLTAANSEELSDRLAMVDDHKLVLVDTAGMGQRDVRLAEQFHSLHEGAPQIKPYLVMSANTQLAALSETIRNFSRVPLAGAVVTKIDESVSLGGVISASIRHRLPLAFVGTGQRVPEDLQPVRSHRLVSKAVALMKQYSEQPEQESMAMRFGRMLSASNEPSLGEFR